MFEFGGGRVDSKVSCIALTPQLEIYLGLVPTFNILKYANNCKVVRHIFTQVSEAGVQVSIVTQRVRPHLKLKLFETGPVLHPGCGWAGKNFLLVSN